MNEKNWENETYKIYGDLKNKTWSYEELKKYFDINGNEYAEVKEDFEMNYFSFKKGEYANIFQTNTGYLIRLSILSIINRKRN